MKKKLFLTAILTLLCCTLLVAAASAEGIEPTKPSGAGTADDPYKISSAAELYWFAQEVNSGDYDACAVLTEDITVNSNVLDKDGNLNDSNFDAWTPICSTNTYDGTFDGNDHTISGLYCSVEDGYIGLFGAVGSGTVKNVNIKDSYFKTTEGFAGGVCGVNNSGTIKNCSFYGTVSGYTVGGVCGNNRGEISNCCNTGKVSAGGEQNVFAGGVCGRNDGGRVSNCYNIGSVSGGSSSTSEYIHVGGVCGQNDDGGTITKCYLLGDTTGGDTKTAEDFASGAVAWLLNQGQTDGPWRQDLNTDTYPVLDSTHKQVVKLTVDGDASYHNSPYVFEGVTGKAYFEGETRIKLPYTVTTDTTLTSKILVTVTADDLVIYVGDELPDGLPYTYTISQNVELNFIVSIFCKYSVEKPGEYPILIGGDEVQGDYAFDYVYGKLTVLQSWIVTVDGEMYYVHPGESFTLPPAPSRPGYIFMGWRSGDKTYGAGDEVYITGDTSFTAVWANIPDITPSEPDALPFTDVSEGAWYYDAVYYVWENGLMNGTEADKFAPNSPLTRAMVWAVLARIDGVEVSGDSWMTTAQKWAVESGVSDGTNPTGYITREQLVTMLWRSAGEPVVDYALTAPDADQISDWALEAMCWAASAGIIEGDESGNLNPTATSTRAHAAVFLMRYQTTNA